MITRKEKGFTLIELIVVMVIIGILAVVAIPRFLDLTSQANQAATKNALSAVRSTLSIKYAENAATGTAAFPSSLTATDFASQALPTSKLNSQSGIGTVGSAPAGTDTSGSNGFWYIVSSGQAGAYSNGTVNTSTW